MTHFIIKQVYRYEPKVAAYLTPSTYDLLAVSLLFVGVSKLIFLLDILKPVDIGFVNQFAYDLFRASLA